jgi:Clp amino terminal domain, pathogenicity island component
MMTTSERIYRVLLKVYPKSYRREYGEPMMQHFRDQLRAASSANKLLSFWFRTLLDLARTAPLRHLESWIPHHGNVRFNDDALQAIFFARYEASSFSRSEIALEHLLLGLLRNNSVLRSTLGRRGVEDVVRRIEAAEAALRRIPGSEDLPLSQECKRAANQATHEADVSREPRVSTWHLIGAILLQETTLAARILRDSGIDRTDL